MARFQPTLDDALVRFIGEQKVYFTATAPRADEGRINLSPKGIDTFRCLDERTVAYLDLTGSGNETAAHLLEPGNGRMTIMFCSFGPKPLILRLYGRGRPVRPRDAGWAALAAHFPVETPGTRQIIVLDVQNVQTSCGFGVPVFEHPGDERPLLTRWATKKGADGITQYWREKNAVSIDGLPSHLSA